MSSIRYRADIDGLRAIAVISVILFHLGIITYFPGGFVGVDVFFVISGYLITKIIVREQDSGTYSTLQFYARRIKRIFPALFFVMAVSLVWCFAQMFPIRSADQVRSFLAALVFVSNILFFFKADYFDASIHNDLMLHTWSLSVEEQFYIVFPIAMLALRRLTDLNRNRVVVGTAILSLLACGLLTSAYPSATFYLMPFRAWELLLGSIVALNIVPPISLASVRQGVALAGLAAIGGTVLFVDESFQFPGFIAALPVVGAAALIHTGARGEASTLVNRLLALPPMRFLGLISYSLYLWHWPIIIFVSNEIVMRGVQKLAVLGACILVATFSWYFIERPFRRPVGERTEQARVLWWGLAGSGAVAALAAVVPIAGEAYWHPPAAANRALASLSAPVAGYMRKETCFITGSSDVASYHADTCLRRDSARPTVLIIGDSHAAHLFDGYATAYPGWNVLMAAASGCKPILEPRGLDGCVALMRRIGHEWLPANRVDTVIVSAKWEPGDVAAAVAMANAMVAHADRVVLMGPLPAYRRAVPLLVANAITKGEDAVRYADRYRMPEPQAAEALFRAARLAPGASYASPLDLLCTPLCRVTTTDGTPLQFDYGHLTQAGSRDVARRFAP